MMKRTAAGLLLALAVAAGMVVLPVLFTVVLATSDTDKKIAAAIERAKTARAATPDTPGSQGAQGVVPPASAASTAAEASAPPNASAPPAPRAQPRPHAPTPHGDLHRDASAPPPHPPAPTFFE